MATSEDAVDVDVVELKAGKNVVMDSCLDGDQ